MGGERDFSSLMFANLVRTFLRILIAGSLFDRIRAFGVLPEMRDKLSSRVDHVDHFLWGQYVVQFMNRNPQ